MLPQDRYKLLKKWIMLSKTDIRVIGKADSFHQDRYTGYREQTMLPHDRYTGYIESRQCYSVWGRHTPQLVQNSLHGLKLSDNTESDESFRNGWACICDIWQHAMYWGTTQICFVMTTAQPQNGWAFICDIWLHAKYWGVSSALLCLKLKRNSSRRYYDSLTLSGYVVRWGLKWKMV